MCTTDVQQIKALTYMYGNAFYILDLPVAIWETTQQFAYGEGRVKRVPELSNITAYFLFPGIVCQPFT